MRKLVVLCILTLNCVNAQHYAIDSLKIALARTQNDTVKCKLLFELAESAPDLEWEHYNTELKNLSLSKLRNKSISNALSKFYTKYLANALNNEALISQDQGETYLALKKYYQSYELSKKIGDNASIATVLNNIGTIYERVGKPDSALFFYKQSLSICESAGDLKGASNSLSNIGSIYQSLGNYSEALNFYGRSLAISSKIGDKEGEALSLSKTGSIQFELEDYDNALKNLNAVIKIREAVKDLSGLTELYNSKGAIYVHQKKYDEAAIYHMEALKIAYQLKDPGRIAHALINVSTLLEINGKSEQALDSLFKSVELYKSISSTRQCAPLHKIAGIQLKRSNFVEAKKNALAALNIAKNNGEVEMLPAIYKLLSTIYKNTGDYKEALTMNDLYEEALIKLNNAENLKKIYQAQYKYEYTQRTFQDSLKADSEKKVYSLKLKQERTNLYLLLMGVAFLLVVGYFLFQQYKQKQKQKIILLRNKIASDLHDDIGSALSSIKLLAGISKTDIDAAKKNELVSKIEKTSLETIETMNDIIWSVNTKNDSLKVIVDKMKEFGEKICFSAEIRFELKNEHLAEDTSLDIVQRKNVYLIFKEAVNNAVKHSGATAISVNLSGENNKIALSIADNGSGFDAENAKSNGNGLESMKTRAVEAGGSLTLTSNRSGTHILLQIKTT